MGLSYVFSLPFLFFSSPSPPLPAPHGAWRLSLRCWIAGGVRGSLIVCAYLRVLANPHTPPLGGPTHLESCALAIEMVNTFPPNVLVSDPAAYPASDVSTWSDISAAALAVQQRCLLSREAAGMPKWTGWSQVGMLCYVMFLSCFGDGCLVVC